MHLKFPYTNEIWCSRLWLGIGLGLVLSLGLGLGLGFVLGLELGLGLGKLHFKTHSVAKLHF